jgi:CBS domain-containing protein
MRERHVGDVIIVDPSRGQRPVGIVTDRDIVVEVVAAGLDPAFVKVADLVLEPLVTVTTRTDYADTVRTMAEHGVRRLPVLDDAGALFGLITLDDLLAQLVAPLAELASVPPRERRREMKVRP